MNQKKHRFKKHLGQNFLKNKDIAKKIVGAAGDDFSDLNIVEVGPGQGSLTDFIILKNPKSLTLVEKDNDLISLLNEKYQSAKIVNQDALKLKLSDLLINDSEKLTIISNLPYNVGTVLLLDWIQQLKSIEKIVVMLQKEVIDRFVAKAGVKNYGITSVLLQSLCNIEVIMNVSRKNFYPEPNVESAVVKIVPKIQTDIDLDRFSEFSKFVHLIFNQRRRKIGTIFKNNNLKTNEQFSALLEKRAEQLHYLEIINLFKDTIK